VVARPDRRRGFGGEVGLEENGMDTPDWIEWIVVIVIAIVVILLLRTIFGGLIPGEQGIKRV
jgi:hypothetical protein